MSRASKGELLDLLATSALGRALEPVTLLMKRNQRASLTYENTRILTLAFSYLRSENVPGAYAEFGVWKGRTFTEAWRLARRIEQTDREFWAFDSFAGLPAVGGIDDTGRWETGEFRHGRADFEASLRRARVAPDRVHIVEGFYDDALVRPESLALPDIALALVDCDLYVSTVPVLDYLTPRIQHGAILLFDDWFCFKGASDRGEAKACEEWLETNPDISLVPWRQFSWAGQGFIVRRAGAV